MSLFDQINARITENLQNYGHYLTGPHAPEEEKIAETVDILIQFVRTQILDIIRREADPAERT